MNVAVIGGGSVGLLLAARLQLCRHHIYVITRGNAQAKQLMQEGITLRQLDGKMVSVTISALSMNEQWPSAEVYLLAVKQPDLPDLLPYLKRLPPTSRVIALQNGMGHRELLESVLTSEQLFYAVNTEGALRVSPVGVEHTGSGQLLIGPWEREACQDQIISAFVSAACSSGINATQLADIGSAMWRKLLANALINPLTALYEVKNGELVDNPDLLLLMRQLFEEAMLVANAMGQKINHFDWQEILTICRNTSRNHSSMLQDLWNEKPTEIDAINGYIVTRGKECGIPTPMHETLLRAVLLKTSLRFSRRGLR